MIVRFGGGGLAPKLLIRESHLGPPEVSDEPSSVFPPS